MIKFYTNQELSHKLGINLARWKRWSREFLPPDPLGGLQSGYARQYTADQAFTVYLGGYLVGDLKFSIPEARLILLDLHNWLAEQQFYSDYTRGDPSTRDGGRNIDYYQIAVCRSADADCGGSGFFYITKGVIADELEHANGIPVRKERFVESAINKGKMAASIKTAASYRVINISVLRNRFLTSLDGSGTAT
jgi:hypothetical protein